MKMRRIAELTATAVIASGLAMGSAVGAAPVTSAAPAAPVPLKPGHGGDDWCRPWCGNGNGNGNGRGGGPKWDNGWDKGPWWANNKHEWWDDRNGAPPWGWGPPPPYHWNGGPLPQSIDYYGYRANPVWNDGNRQWGVWVLGQWIPIFGVGVN